MNREGYLGLGSNVGDRRAQLEAAVSTLPSHGVRVLASSSVYETEPVGLVPDQRDFLNACVRIETELDQNLASIQSREQIVQAVKAEVEAVHQISARSKADLAHVTEHRADVTALKARVDELLSRIAETDERIVAIEFANRLAQQ